MLTDLPPLPAFCYLFPVALSLLWPVVIGWGVAAWTQSESLALAYNLLFWTFIGICQAAIYAIYRPGLHPWERLTAPLA